MTDMEQKKVFSGNLNTLLSMNNLSQREVASAIGVSPQTFNTWTQGIALPRMGKIQALADYFNVPKARLIDKSAGSKADDLNSLQKDERSLLTSYRKLNDFGKKKAREDVEDLTYVPRYVKDSDPTLLQAAHQRTDIEIPEGVDTSDDKFFD